MLFIVTIILIITLVTVWVILKSRGDFSCLINPIKGISLGIIYEDEREEDGTMTYYIQIIIWFVTFTFVWHIENKEKEEEDEEF